jgi:hypothetical protein
MHPPQPNPGTFNRAPHRAPWCGMGQSHTAQISERFGRGPATPSRATAFRRWLQLLSVCAASVIALDASVRAENGFLEMRNGYFWDPARAEYFVPRGIAYQLWNPPVGANQSFEQLAYDLTEFKKMYANSVRCEFVWSQIEIAEGTYDWTKPDRLMAEAERLGLRLFILIGFQYPPPWFPKEWHGINDQGLTVQAVHCLSNDPPSDPWLCLPPAAADCLRTRVPPELLANVQDALLTGARNGGRAGVLQALQTAVPAGLLSEVLPCLISDVINYEHPEARAAYRRYMEAITGRYKDRPVIGAWILGNEYAYFDLWENPTLHPVRRMLGFDEYSLASFRGYLATGYQGDIQALNAVWGTDHADFESVLMPSHYPADRLDPRYHDLIQWRKQSVGDFVALGAVATREADPNHLRTYSMVGGIFNGRDANNTCEDAHTIVARCQAAGAPLHFWSINNYAWAAIGSELRTGVFGISKYQDQSGLPVMISETGHSSTEDLFDFPNAGTRQPKAVPGHLWESLVAGAIGTHLFHWNDRSQFTEGFFLRERGFGIVHQTRLPKEPVHQNVVHTFRRMQEIHIERLLGGSIRPPPDVHFLWSTNSDMGWPRANQENAMIWGALKRLGYQPAILDDAMFEAGAFTNAPALLLSRSSQLAPQQLAALRTRVLPAGIHIHANADLPGQFDAYHRPNPHWTLHMNSLFGVNTQHAVPGAEAIATNDFYTTVRFQGLGSLGPVLVPTYSTSIQTWKVWHGVAVADGRAIVTHSGHMGTAPGTPALVIRNHLPGHGATALNTFALGDTFPGGVTPSATLWDLRYDWLRAIYRSHFGLTPSIELTGPGAKHVMPDHRVCPNGSVLVSLLNLHTNKASVTLHAPALLAGRTIENLTGGGILETGSSGAITLQLDGDDFLLLYAYDRVDNRDASLIHPDPSKIWFLSAPTAVWPRGVGYEISIGTDLPEETEAMLFVGFEQTDPHHRMAAVAPPVSVGAGRHSHLIQVPIPDADLNDPGYVSSPEGGRYLLRAWLERGGVRSSDVALPVRLLWGVRPLNLPTSLTPTTSYTIPVKWEELPSALPNDPTPMNRALLWDSVSAPQHYNIVLELSGASGHLLAVTNITSQGSGTHQFPVTIPAHAEGPFLWSAQAQTAPETTALDVLDGFEGRDLGDDRSPLFPWFAYTYPEGPGVTRLSEGVVLDTSRRTKAGYLLVSISPDAAESSGLGIIRSTDVWSLPDDPALRSQILFACDFRETTGQECVLELQVIDAHGNRIQFSRPYVPGPLGWDRLSMSLDQFVIPDVPGATFDPDVVSSLAVNIQPLQNNKTFEARFDNIRFTGPPAIQDDFEDRPTRAADSRIAPWLAYGYDEPGHRDVLLAQGVHLDPSEGSQSAFVVAWNRTDSEAFAGFGLIRPFDQEWELPSDVTQWKDYSFSFDFKEANQRACTLELQLKNHDDPDCAYVIRAIQFTKPYTPGPDGWDTITATLDQFQQPDYFCPFDQRRVFALVANVQMLETNPDENVVYVGSFDRIRFHAPITAGPGDMTVGLYTSADDSFGFTAIQPASPGRITLTWVGEGTLEWAPNLDGTWTPLPDATSPATLDSGMARAFYRLRR